MALGESLFLLLDYTPIILLAVPFYLQLIYCKWKPNMSSLWTWGSINYDRMIGTEYQKREHDKEFPTLEPTPLPASRKRWLSQGRLVIRAKFAFLTKLSLEIRQMVYEEVIRDNTRYRHIVEFCNMTSYEHKRARNQLCDIGCTNARLNVNRGAYLSHILASNLYGTTTGLSDDRHHLRMRKPGTSHNPLALAKSCRQAYMETIDMFYCK